MMNTNFAAKRLLGSYLIRKEKNEKLIGQIVETEVYHECDPASHSCRGRTKRCEVMFGPPGIAYVYIIYGIYYCFNIVTEKEGVGAAVLIRALKPIKGIQTMKKNRGGKVDVMNLCNGPGKLCQALNISKTKNGLNLFNKNSSLQLKWAKPIKNKNIVKTKRIGISKAKHKLLRFYVKNLEFISQK